MDFIDCIKPELRSRMLTLLEPYRGRHEYFFQMDRQGSKYFWKCYKSSTSLEWVASDMFRKHSLAKPKMAMKYGMDSPMMDKEIFSILSAKNPVEMLWKHSGHRLMDAGIFQKCVHKAPATALIFCKGCRYWNKSMFDYALSKGFTHMAFSASYSHLWTKESFRKYAKQNPCGAISLGLDESGLMDSDLFRELSLLSPNSAGLIALRKGRDSEFMDIDLLNRLEKMNVGRELFIVQ